ncbi:MAG: hypothetical protein ACFFC7_18710 [Candidatus Hermodarchaeota archaeon]
MDELREKAIDYLGTLPTYFRSEVTEAQVFSPSIFLEKVNRLKDEKNLAGINDILYSYWPDFQKTISENNETKFDQILRSFKDIYELINLDDDYFPITNTILAFSYILGVKIVQEEKWKLLSLLID